MLAIIIPYYKIDFFEETLKSVAAQSEKRFVLHIGNDASLNDPTPLMEKYFPERNYFYYAYKENVGRENLALHWKRILDNVKEEWFQILGDDDVLSKNFVQEFYAVLPEVRKKNINIIKTGLLWIDEKNNVIENNVYEFNIIAAQELFIKKYRGEIRSSLSENIYKTKLAKKYKFEQLPLAWGTDDLSLLSFSENGFIQYIAKPLLYVRISQQSISGSIGLNEEKDLAYFHFKEKLFTLYSKWLPQEFVSKEILKFIDQCYVKGYKIPYCLAGYFFRIGKVKLGISALKKIYYIKKKYGS